MKKRREKVYLYYTCLFPVILFIILFFYTKQYTLHAEDNYNSILSDSIDLIAEYTRTFEIVASIGSETITMGEFENEFFKTNKDTDSLQNLSYDNKLNLLNLFIRYRLKVKDARERGLLYDAELLRDVEEYKQHVLPILLIDRYIEEIFLKQLYERRKYEVRASHIMINLSEKPTPEDSIKAYLIADTIIQKLNNGEDFSELALHYSDDRTVIMNRGDLYYFTAGMTVESFEEAVYSLNVGEFTTYPVRTQWGLHIVKLTAKNPRLESIRTSHILIMDKRDSIGNLIDSLNNYDRALEVYNKAINGEEWNSLVQQYSEDPGTYAKAGDLGYFDRGQMTQVFDSAAFSLLLNEISKPVKTEYGWHIIKKTGEKPYGSYETQKEDLKNNFKKTIYY